MDIVATFRIVFIALAASFGVWLSAAGVLGVWELAQASLTANAADGPPEFSFSTYGYIPAVGVVVLVSAGAALKRRFHVLAIACWLLTGAVIVDVIDAILTLAWTRVPAMIGTVWTLVPLVGFALSLAARQRGERPGDTVPSASRQERIRLRNTLVSLVVVSYVWRAVFIVSNPAAAGAIAILRGTSGVYLLTNGVVALGAALVLLTCAIVSFKNQDRLMNAALAFTAGLSFDGFLYALDLALIGGARLEIMYALQDAVAFVTCCVALALSSWPAQQSSRLPA